MEFKEAATLLSTSVAALKSMIDKGLELPVSKKTLFLEAIRDSKTNEAIGVDESDLDKFLKAFEDEEPGRYPPVAVRRHLLVEAWHRCGICKNIGPIQFHHIVEFHKIKHHDVTRMIALCPTCHQRITNGEIDAQTQFEYKKKLVQQQIGQNTGLASDVDIGVDWGVLARVIDVMHADIKAPVNPDGKYDLSAIDLPRKNALNGLTDDYFSLMKDEYEPHFYKINDFLSNPINEAMKDKYYDLAAEMKFKIAGVQSQVDSIGSILKMMFDQLCLRHPEIAEKNQKFSVLTLLSFMYMNCDVGRK